jgi:uncharacterized protein
MSEIRDILSNVSHRTYHLPDGQWVYYQEWNRALFLHWVVPMELLRPLVPAQFTIDTFEGNAYVSVVPFTMEKIRPRFFPAVRWISDFDEINVRTYIKNDEKEGVYFLNIEAGKARSALVAKLLSGLPYEKAKIYRTYDEYHSENAPKGFKMHAAFDVQNAIHYKTELDKWLTERYCLYLDEGSKLYRYDIHHKEWNLRDVSIRNLHIDYNIGKLYLADRAPNLAHYSDGIKVIAWRRKKIPCKEVTSHGTNE